MMKSIEPIILAVALAVLGIGAGLLAYFYPSVSDITGITSSAPKGKQTLALNQADVESSLAPWNSPMIWSEPASHHRLFHSDGYLFYPSAYPSGDYIKKFEKDTRSPSGVLLSWYQKYSLDFTDPNIDREDPDNDGFSTLVEFRNDPVGERQKAADCDGTKSTNPLDSSSHPDFLARLRLQKYESRPFHIQFKGYQQLNGTYLFQIYLNDVPSSNQPPLKKTGDPLGFEGYIVGAFNQVFKMEKDPATGEVVNTDESVLILEKPEIGLKVPLTFRKEIDSPESTADFVMLMPADTDKVIKVARGKIFTILPYLPKSSFLVLESNDEGAKIRDTGTNKEYHILKLDPNEWNEVPVLPASANSDNPATPGGAVTQ